MFKKTKIKIKVEFDIETGNIKITLRPKETRPSRAILILGEAQTLIEQSLQQVTQEERKEKVEYIA